METFVTPARTLVARIRGVISWLGHGFKHESSRNFSNVKQFGMTHASYLRPTFNANNIPNDTAINTTDRATAVSRSLSAATYTAIGIVCVTPGKFPAKVIVAPNSPKARAHANPTPASRAGRMSGKVTRRKVYHGEARKVYAASS